MYIYLCSCFVHPAPAPKPQLHGSAFSSRVITASLGRHRSLVNSDWSRHFGSWKTLANWISLKHWSVFRPFWREKNLAGKPNLSWCVRLSLMVVNLKYLFHHLTFDHGVAGLCPDLYWHSKPSYLGVQALPVMRKRAYCQIFALNNPCPQKEKKKGKNIWNGLSPELDAFLCLIGPIFILTTLIHQQCPATNKCHLVCRPSAIHDKENAVSHVKFGIVMIRFTHISKYI